MASFLSGLLSAATRTTVTLAGKGFKGIVGLGTGAVWNTLTREVDYQRNYKAPTQFPGFDDLTNAYFCGLLDVKTYIDFARYNAVNLGAQGAIGSVNDVIAWDAVISAHKPSFEPDTARLFYRGNRISLREFYWHARRGGLADKRMFELFKDQSTGPDILETIQLWLRGKLTADELKLRFAVNGVVDENHIEYFLELANLLPTPSDLIAMAVKDAWDKDAVKRFGYDEEFPPEFQEFAEKIGLGGDARTKDQIKAGDPKITWPEMYWRAHWQTIAPTLAYEFFHRARGNPADPKTWRIPGVEPFTADDLQSVLKINDYPVRFRKYLTAVSYNIISQLRLKGLLLAHIIDDKEVAEYYQDNGFNIRDAQRLTRMLVAQVNKQRRAKLGVATLPWLKKSYNAGAINADQARYYLLLHKFEDSERYAELEKMDRNDAIGIARNDQDVSAALAQWDLEYSVKLLERRIAAIKKAFIRGILNIVQAELQLRAIGVDQTRIVLFLKDWQIDLLATEKEVSAAKVLHWYRIGLIGLPEAQNRLLNLKYPLRDVVIMLSEEQRNILLDIATAQLKSARTAEQKRKALIAQQRALEAAHNRSRSELARHGSVNQLGKWYVRGIIDEKTLTKRLEALDWPKEDIDNLKRELDADKAARDAKKGPSTPKPTEPKQPKVDVARLQRWFKMEIISEQQFRERLEGLGYGPEDIERFVREVRPLQPS